MAMMGECSGCGCLPAGPKYKGCSLAYKLAATWRRHTFIHVIRVNFRNGFATDDSTITSCRLL